jgi:mannose-6-phosphate isomerase-like protein (cupin superfamily)
MIPMENRRNILKLAGISAAFGMPLAATGAAARLGDVIVDAKHARLESHSFGDLRVFFEGPTAQLKSMTAGSLLLKPGQEPHPPHQHPEEEFMIVTEGTGQILVGGKMHQVGPGCMMYSEANQLHGVKNTGSVPLLFYYLLQMARLTRYKAEAEAPRVRVRMGLEPKWFWNKTKALRNFPGWVVKYT